MMRLKVKVILKLIILHLFACLSPPLSLSILYRPALLSPHHILVQYRGIIS
jgi:hypothetical protein